MLILKFFVLFYLFLLAFIDFKNLMVPQNLLIGFFSTVFSLNIKYCYAQIAEKVLIGILFLLLFTCIAMITKGLGAGDVKIISILGFSTGFFENICICLFASLSGLLYFSIMKIKKSNVKKIAFVPFLLAGYLMTVCGKSVYIDDTVTGNATFHF